MSRYPRAVVNQPTSLPRRTYRIDEVKTSLGVGRSTVYKLIDQGTLKSIKLNGINLILADSVEAMLKADA